MAKASWDIQIIDDGVHEDLENFVVQISSPVNAILGKKTKTRVKLINADNGRFYRSVSLMSLRLL